MADHTGKRARKSAEKRIDTSSIKTTTLLSFVVFALFLVMVLWGLSNFYLNSFYERTRSQEVIRTAETLEAQFRQDRFNFGSLAVQTAGTNGIYIRIDTPEESLIYDGTSEVEGSDAFENDVSRIKTRLEASESGSVSIGDGGRSVSISPAGSDSGKGIRIIGAANITDAIRIYLA